MSKSTKQKDRIVLSIKRCIESKFLESDWTELAYLTNGKDIIYKHQRLLRSLSFGDQDYGDCIFDVIEKLLARDPGNLQIIIDFIGLQEWLKENHPQDFEELYGHTQPLLDTTEEIAIANSFELNQHIVRIRRAVESDPELAVGSTKELLESVLKTILEGFGEKPGKDDMPKLLKRTQKVLNLNPSEVDLNMKGAEIIIKILNSIGQVVIGVNELRNIYGTGHGQVHKSGITPDYARLVAGTGATIAMFLMENFEMQKQKDTGASS
ncbi:abortive infection family protein [Trichocoleus sp. DQ-A3]|uniref:abortive infection family protein n=1 Tax=Cyanophyceae TaxID=3028117 RepID=UPI001681D557|nr:abortive infection family protein [Coleofasciculus sp. FACHB-125]MBD1898863.1 abortive infection family protein [Coleofasciculus sp. FACHB-125]